MNGKLVDTNILIYLSKRILEFEKVVDPEVKLYISIITYMEVLGFNFESNVEKKMVEQLCKLFPIIDLNPKIVDKVISIRQRHKIKLPDAIILATAIVSNLELITANVNDFINIEPGLKIQNPLQG
jgi:predicted nucleic acid-binding protein